ncbi:MAG TPA: VOC family protein, partial [Polyangiaceae bacterium]
MDLNQVTLLSRDVARSAAFYRKLGLLQIVEDLPTYVRFEMPNGSSTLSLHLAEPSSASGTQGDLGAILYFECEALDATVRELKAAGVVFQSDPTDQPWLWREASLRDPDGHEIRLYYAGTNRKNPPWRLATQSYVIRLARLDEISRIREIEDDAGTMFSGLGLIDERLDASF